MSNYEPGEQVAVRCEAQPGAFPGEFLVTLHTVEGNISGFVTSDDLMNDPTPALKGIIRSVRDGILVVWLSGSFFNTNGLAEIRSDNVRRLAVA
jgi:hypothetical protein